MVSKMMFLAASAVVMTLGGVAAAQDEAPARKQGVQGVGLGMIVGTQPYLAIDEEVRVNIIPALAYDRGRVWIQGKQIGVILTDPDGAGPWEVSGLLEYRFQGYEADESPIFAGMEDRDGTAEAGAVVTYSMGDARLVGQARVDVLDGHGGFDLLGQAEFTWAPTPATQIKPYAGLLMRSEELADYYYGVLPEEAAVDPIVIDGTGIARGAYAPGETVNPFVGVSARQFLSRQLAVGMFVRHDFLPDEIKNSPIIDADSQTSGGIFISRAFLGQ